MNDVTQIGGQLQSLGLADESPQQAAERLWKETGKGPVKMIIAFEAWAREDPERMTAVLGGFWYRAVRTFLSRDNRSPNAWRYSDSFRVMWRRAQMVDHQTEVWTRQKESPLSPSLKAKYARDYQRRKSAGIKRVYADVSAEDGRLLRLIDKDFGPYGSIRINNNPLPETTPEEALAWCEKQETGARFVRALCSLLPDPTQTIGAQWSEDLVRQAIDISSCSSEAEMHMERN